ncbi:sulfatase [Lutimonas saemankumensis]|uniref:sulfatase n=1 Tax=Lutimonas saemankumensis TaxID=483016 RepID=UPI001CD7DBFD|nr:sulfatase [Lutimonas saemankumensis]MCA0932466.1 sulfatase [Lutimonas saemankumensis]
MEIKKISTEYLIILFFFFIQVNEAQEAKERPNVILIMCDDLNDYQQVFGGHKQAITPNIDKMAKTGVQFINAQSNVPVCQPSRNSLFTGVYPHRSKDYGWTDHRKQPVLKNNKTIMRMFQENGYYTLGTGKLTHGKSIKNWDKWGLQINHNYGPLYFDGENLGSNPSVPFPYSKIGPVDGSYGRLSDAGTSEGKIKGEKGWVYGRDKKPFRYIHDNDRDLLQDELHAKWAVQQIKEMEQTAINQPFFMGIGFVRPHTPLHAPDKYFDMFPMDELELSDWIPEDKNDTFWDENFKSTLKGPRYYKTILDSYGGNRELALKHFLQAYLACVAFVDDQIGFVLDALDKSKFRENTIVIVTSDHGWQMGEKQFLFKNSPWEESARIPLVIHSPSMIKAAKVKQPVSLIDLFPTLMELCNLEGNHKINDQGGDLGGYSLVPFLLDDNEKSWEGPSGALTIVGNCGKSVPTENQNFSYRTENFRYILYGNGNEELYDHEKDPFEWKNVAQKKSYKKIRKNLRTEMMKIIETR